MAFNQSNIISGRCLIFTLLFVMLAACLLAPVASGRCLDETKMNEIYGNTWDPSCKGSYNPKLYKKLSKVCNDCSYVFNDNMGHKCKVGCFSMDEFGVCVKSLKLSFDKLEKYASHLRSKC